MTPNNTPLSRPFPPNRTQIVKAAEHLEHLDLTGCDAVGDELCAALPSARFLNLSFVPISDQGLWRLGGRALRLEELVLARHSHNIFFTGLYTQEGVAALTRRLPKVGVKYTM